MGLDGAVYLHSWAATFSPILDTRIRPQEKQQIKVQV